LGGEGEIPTIVILPPIVMLNLFQHPFARRPWILKQVQGDECLQGWEGDIRSIIVMPAKAGISGRIVPNFGRSQPSLG